MVLSATGVHQITSLTYGQNDYLEETVYTKNKLRLLPSFLYFVIKK